MRHEIRIVRVYDDAGGKPSDGFRLFVDRLWPRGESKEKFQYDMWAKGISPSTELREWFHADPDTRWPEFERKYMAELDANPRMAELLVTLQSDPEITLLYASRDKDHNNAVVLAKYLEAKLG